LFLPKGIDLKSILDNLDGFSHLTDHHKYANNYYYQKSILGVNSTPHLDTGFALFIENKSLVSPISMIYYENYNSVDELREKLDNFKDKIQCIVSKNGWYDESIPFGKAQQPDIHDYADDVDTMKFLENI
jgi:hypothetical protein